MTTELQKLNFRDLGGISSAGGLQLRNNIIYRCEGPASFSPAQQRELNELGIKLICDLRAGVERDAAPNDWNQTARLFNMELKTDLRVHTNAGWAALREDPTEAGARRAMRLNYAAMPVKLHGYISDFVNYIIGGEIPVLIHCTAGKDRTGVLIALILTFLGVSRAAVQADYLRSDMFAKNTRIGASITHAFETTFGFAPHENVIDAMLGASPDYLDTAFASVTETWGSVAGYFAAAGVTDEQAAQFKEQLLMR